MSRLPSVALTALLAASWVMPAPAAGPEPPPPQFLLSWGKKGQGKGEFRSPIGIAIDQDDRVYVTEFHNNRVQKFDSEGQFLASFPVAEHPGGIAVDRDGNVYVAPLLLGKVCVYGPDGHFVRAWGKPGQGDGEFKDPGGIAIDRDGHVYVADQSNHRVQKFTRQGKFLAKFGRHGSQPGEFGGKGKAGARFAGPHFLAFDAQGDLHATEGAEGRVQKLTANGQPLLAWGDNGSGPGGFGGREKAKTNALPGPVGVCVDRRGRVWVSSTNDRVQLFSAEGKYLLTLGEQGHKQGQFKLPHGLAVDGKSHLYVVDSSNQRVQKFAIDRPAVPPETPEQAKRRHQRVAERRKGTDVICHRGASEHAHENTLEAFRATFELGGDGNEFDIRQTKDGVLVVFHDDMLDRLLEAYGDVSDYSWKALQRVRFREPGRFGAQCRIPTLVEVFDLHRKHGGLMHLDIKRPGLDRAIADLLTRMDLWDHVGYCNTETGGIILRDPRYKPRRYKAGLYQDRSEVFPDAIATALKRPGDGVIVDDPRGVAVALGRKLGKLSQEPVSPRKGVSGKDERRPVEVDLIATLRNADDWDHVAETAADQAASGQRIRARARAAEGLLAAKASSKEAFAALEERVRKRSLHKDWMYHGFDGAMAQRALLLLRAPNAVATARFALWRDDPALEPVIDPRWKNSRAWTDFRVKMAAWPALAKCPGAATEQLCRDYLALSDEEARKLGPPQFEEATRSLLAVSPRSETALELMRHRLQAVRGRAILGCLAHAKQEWAKAALEKGARHTLAYRVED